MILYKCIYYIRGRMMVVPKYALLLIAILLFVVFRYFIRNRSANKRAYQLLADTNLGRATLLLEYANLKKDFRISYITSELVYKVTESLLHSGDLEKLFHAYDLLNNLRLSCCDNATLNDVELKERKYTYMQRKLELQSTEYEMYMERMESLLKKSGFSEDKLKEYSHGDTLTNEYFVSRAKELVDNNCDVRLLFDNIK